MDNPTVWQEAKKTLRGGMTKATFDNTLKEARLIEVNGQEWTIGVTTGMAKEWLEVRLRDVVKRAFSNAAGYEAEVKFILVEAEKPAPSRRPATYSQEAAIKMMTAHHVLTHEWPEPAWAVQGRLPVGLALLGGKQKIGKSWLSLQLAKSLALGVDFLGQPVGQGKFLYLSLEDHPKRLQDRMRKQGWPDDEVLKLSGFMVWSQFEENIGDLASGGSEALANLIRVQQYKLVVVDTFSRAFRGDQNDADLVTMALSPIQEMAFKHNCVVMILDHHRKLFSADADVVLDVLGSIAKGAVADTIWGLYRERGKAQAKLTMTGRDIEEQSLALQIDPAAGLWQLDGNGDAGALELTERRQEILDALADLGRARVGEIAAAIDQNRGNTYSRLQDLTAAALVKRTMEQGGHVWYELAVED